MTELIMIWKSLHWGLKLMVVSVLLFILARPLACIIVAIEDKLRNR